jgi:hypothetical protein
VASAAQIKEDISLPEVACLACLNPAEQLAAQIYLLAIITDTSIDPAYLVAQTRCLICLPCGELAPINAYLLAQKDLMNKGPEELLELAGNLSCIPWGWNQTLRTYYWGLRVGILNPSTLKQLSRCILCIPQATREMIFAWLLAKWANMAPETRQDLCALQAAASEYADLSDVTLDNLTTWLVTVVTGLITADSTFITVDNDTITVDNDRWTL